MALQKNHLWTICRDHLCAQKGTKVDGMGINLGVPHFYAQRPKGAENRVDIIVNYSLLILK